MMETKFKERFVAHRFAVAESGALENSLEGMRQALADFYFLECDVRLTQDGELVVYHDDKVMLGEREEYLSSIHSAVLKIYYPHVPKLEEVLAIAKRQGHCHLLLDLKGTDIRLAKALAKVLPLTQEPKVTFLVFSPTLADQVHHDYRHIDTLQLTVAKEANPHELVLSKTSQIQDFLENIQRCGLQSIGVEVCPDSQDYAFWRMLVEEAHARKLKVHAWFDRHIEAKLGKVWIPFLLSAGVDWINTDYPKQTKAILSTCLFEGDV